MIKNSLRTLAVCESEQYSDVRTIHSPFPPFGQEECTWYGAAVVVGASSVPRPVVLGCTKLELFSGRARAFMRRSKLLCQTLAVEVGIYH